MAPLYYHAPPHMALELIDEMKRRARNKREVESLAAEEETNQKMMAKIALLAKLKFDAFKQKLEFAFYKLQKEFEPIGQKYKSYGENVSMLAVNGLKSFAKANVDIFNAFQEKVKGNLNGLLDDGKQFLNLVKVKTLKPFGK